MTKDEKSAGLKDAGAVLGEIEGGGLLFLSDPKRRSAIEVLTGACPKGSWWSHPLANDIYGVLQAVEDHPDVMTAKLLDGKVTFVHRGLWPALLAVVTAREPWQVEGLSPGAVGWLAGHDEAEASGGELPSVSRTISKEIEARLLAHAESVHTEKGKHETRLQSWRAWAEKAGAGEALASLPAAKAALEAAAARLGVPLPALPWAKESS